MILGLSPSTVSPNAIASRLETIAISNCIAQGLFQVSPAAAGLAAAVLAAPAVIPTAERAGASNTEPA